MQKDLGHTQISEKKATFDSTINKSVVEDNRSQQVHSTKNVMQSENVQVSENKKVFSTHFESSQSFESEEFEEYEIQG